MAVELSNLVRAIPTPCFCPNKIIGLFATRVVTTAAKKEFIQKRTTAAQSTISRAAAVDGGPPIRYFLLTTFRYQTYSRCLSNPRIL
jgi:hypothetical protein